MNAEERKNWWDENLPERMEEFKSWIGDFNAESKMKTRKHIESKGYKSILDCGCGLCTEYYGFLNDGYDIGYTGIDCSRCMVKMMVKKGIDVHLGSLENTLPFMNNAFDVVICRHVLEHLSSFKNALKEMCRVAKKEIIIIFFMSLAKKTVTNYDKEENIYHNNYGKDEFENFIRVECKAHNFQRVNFNTGEFAYRIAV